MLHLPSGMRRKTPPSHEHARSIKYGIELSRQRVELYDPNKRNGRKKWRTLFDATRKAFLEHVSDTVPEANKSVRVKNLARASRTMSGRGNWGWIRLTT